ncbi:PEP-CTERM system TPR-repeat protein PrsT [Paucibacter sp. APW11]|uniref:PEP-CTERM system TPR-repeat protein PrsT n=1 Tax=Roseateles aquae TaxID=3077235 RepID=A0ABU3P6E1_9BURK|nr:XrtA/PEP-CTERM system TPR-repeat protein PrsT [Paucibacter sp. APW11]MDT8998136.1 PEP-CTERM system TPR-repeat protein PrsT [Paucibacter sp. APW11]
MTQAFSPNKHPMPRTARPLLTAMLLLSLAGLAPATPEKAAKFYEDALQRYEKGDLEGATIQLKNTIQQDNKMLAAHLLLGKVLLKVGELKGAEAAFEEALKQGVSRNEVAIPLGQLYLLLGERKKLLDELTVQSLLPALQPEVLTLRGTAYAMSGNITLATKSFSDAKALDPRSASPFIAEALMYLRAGERDKAKASASRATELGADKPAAWYTLGTVLYAMQDYKGSATAQEKALALDKKHIDARVGHAFALLSLGREKEASTDLALLKEWEVSDPRASYMRALLATRAGDAAAAKTNYAEAVDQIDALPPGLVAGDEPLMMAGALSHHALGNLEKAREYLRTILTLNPKHYVGQMLLASIAVQSKDFTLAVPILETMLRNNPDDTQALYMMGSIQLARKRYPQASELFERAAAKSNSADAVRELGFSQLGLGLDKQGLSNLEKAYAANPADTRSGVQLALTFARQGQSAKALQIAETIVKREPDNLTMINFLGNVRGRIGDKAGARAAFQQVLAKDPAFRPAGINLSWLDIEERRFDEARTRLTQMLTRMKDDPDVLFELGTLELRAGRPAEALRQWQKADDVQRQDPRPGLAMIDYYSSQRQVDKALETAKMLAGKQPSKFAVQLALGRAYLAAGESTNARLSLQEATRLAEFDADKQVAIGRMQLMAGGIDQASYNVQKALQAKPDDLQALVLQTEIEGRRGDAAKIDAALKTLQAKHPGTVPTLLTTGHVAFSRGQFAAAQLAYRAAMDKAPETSVVLLLVQAQIAGGETDKALQSLESWTKKRPDDKLSLRALAEVQLQAGKMDQARKSFAQVVALEPDNASTVAAYAALLQRLNDAGAVAAAEKAVKLAPNDAEVNDVMGWILLQRGDKEGGLRFLREARLRNPTSGEIRLHLAYALAKSGRKAEARDELAAAQSSPVKPQPAEELARARRELGL